MRRWAVLLAALLLAGGVWCGSALAATPDGLPPGLTTQDRGAIQDVIRQQLDAFGRDDASGAYRFAAPNVQAIFPNQDQFMAMVKQGYPPVYRPRSSEFSELAIRDGDLVQEVELVGPDGKPVLALYTMQHMPDGRWLIAACMLIPSARLGGLTPAGSGAARLSGRAAHCRVGQVRRGS